MAKHEDEPQEEEEAGVVDPQTKLREQCLGKPDCTKLSKRLETCNERVRSREKTSETCHEEVVDLFHCVDHCVLVRGSETVTSSDGIIAITCLQQLTCTSADKSETLVMRRALRGSYVA